MYKDVWKRVLAVLVVICMVVTVVQWPQTVKAEPGKTYHTYQYGENESAGFVAGERAAAVFLTSQNESAGAEIFEGISFDVHLEDGVDAAGTGVKAELYTSPEPGNPASGIFVCSNELYNLTEGTNKLSFASISTKLMQGECFSVVLTLIGEGVSFYAQQSAETQCTFISNEDGGWHDTSEEGQTVAIRAVTYDEGLVVTERAGLFERIASALSVDAQKEPVTDETAQPAENLGTEQTELKESPDSQNENLNAGSTIDLEETVQNNMADVSNAVPAQQSAVYAMSGVTLNWRTVTVGVNGEVLVEVQNLPEGATCVWSVADQTVAELTPNGEPAASATVRGLKEGVTAVNVVVTKGQDSVQLSCTVDVRTNTHNFNISLSETSYVYDGQEHKPAVTVKDGETVLKDTADYSVEYVNCVNASTAENPATVKIAGNGIYASERHELLYTIEPKNINDIESLEVSEEIDEAEGLDLSGYIALTDLGAPLTIEKDYTIGEYETASGHHEVVITGKGNYTGTRSVGYTVRRDIADAAITLANNSYTYTGGEIHPEITVTLDGQTVTAENYTVVYENCTEAADAPKITVTGKENYFGTVVLENAFVIAAKNINNTDGTASRVDIKPYPLPIAAKKTSAEDSIPEMTLEYNGKTMTRGTDSTNGDYMINNIRLYDKNNARTTDLAAAVSGSLDIVGQVNFVGTRRVDYSLRNDIKGAIASVAINGTYTYTGTNIEADVIVTAQSGVTLRKGTDYDVEFRNNINAGTAEAYVWGKGNYGGLYIPADAPAGQTWSATFEIQQADFAQLDKDCFQYTQNAPYSPLAEEMYPEVGIVYNGVTIDTDQYTVTVKDEAELKVGGSPKIVVSAAGGSANFTGSRELNYTVTACPLTASQIQVIMTRNYEYTGEAITPVVEVVYVDKNGDRHSLTQGSAAGSDGDYKLELSDNVTAGSKSAVITGRNNYTGVLYEPYEIAKIPLNTLKLEITDATTDYPGYSGNYRAIKRYDGGRQTLNVILTYTNAQGIENILVENTDYTLSYTNNIEMSKEGATAELIIEAKATSNYGGRIVIPFLIAREIDDCKLSGVNGSVEYTGDPITFADLKVTDEIGLFNTNTLVKDIDFAAVYSANNTDVTPGNNPVSLTIQAMPDAQLPTTNGCYIGEKAPFEFAIIPLSLMKIPGDRLSIRVERKLYEGQPVTLEYDDITAVYTTPAGKKITLTNADYDILDSYNDNNKTGTAQAVIKGKGNFTGQIPVPFEIAGKSINDATVDITLDAPSYPYTGAAIKPVVTVKDGTDTLREGVDYTVKYESNVNAGTGKVIVTGIGNYTETAEKPFTITPLHLENDGTTVVTGLIDPIGYSPKGATQTPTVRFTKNGAGSSTLLAEGEQKDYTISYTDNDKAGTATLTVNGKGNYTGSVSETFTIESRELAEDMIQMETSWPYTGTYITPPVTVICDGETLKNGENKDYIVEYENNFAVGSNAVAKITGKNNYTGTVTIPFYITDSIEDETKISITCEAAGRTYTYTGSNIEPAVTVKSIVTGSSLIKGTDYTVSYANNTDVGRATITVEGIKNYSGSRQFTFYIAPQQISAATATLPQSSYTYTGSQIAPKPRVTYNSKTLAEGTDYVLIPGTNIDAGTGTVTLSGINNFAGTNTLEFAIVPKSIGSGNAFATGFSMDKVEPQGYTGSEIRPTPQVYVTQSGVKTALVYGEDYSFAYANNINNGTARIIVKGENNYTGSVTGTFEIRANIADAAITVADTEYEDWLSAGAAKPEPSVSLNGVALIKDRDYTVSYDNNTMPGEATVVIKGKGSYGGEVRATFAIYGDLSKADADPIENQPYTGSAVTPVPSVNYHGIPLRSGGIDYTLSYSGNTEIGTATITLVGDGYYRGSKEVKFTIIPSAGNFVIPQIAAQKYCGKQIKPEVTVYYGDRKLTEKDDYTVSYGSNTDAGVGTVTITGAGNYSNIATVTRTFAINPLLMSELTLSDSKSDIAGVIAPMEYTGNALLPTTLKLYYEEDGKTIYTLKTTDYTVTCPDDSNIAVGTAHIVIGENNGNIIGSRSESFEITAKNINNVTYSIAGANQTYSGKELKPEITLRNGQTIMEAGTDYTVEYEDNINVGTAKIKLTGIGNYVGERTVNFKIAALPISSGRISVEPVPEQIYMGVPVTPELSLAYTDEDGEVIPLTENDFRVVFTNNNRAGTARATLTGLGNFSGSRVVNFTIAQHDIGADDIIVAEIPNQAYTGKQVTPAVTITCGEYTLNQKTDYTLTYANNTEIGTATVTITGRGNFTGTRTASFAIASSIENAQLTGLAEEYTFTGSDVEPEGITVRIGATDLVLGEDYIVSYEDNRNAGTAQLVITGRGNYGGIKKIPFEITPKSLEDSDILLNGFQSSMVYNGDSVEQDITLTYGEETLETPRDYTVRYVGNDAIGTAQMIVEGTGNYKDSITREFVIMQYSIADENLQIGGDISTTYTYSGNAVEPKPTLSLNGVELVEGQDYELSYENNMNVGVATMKITGINSYTGEREESFTILRRSVTALKYGNIGRQVYNGADCRPAVTVSDASKTLSEGSDYTLLYSNNGRPGTAVVTVLGKGNYTATKTLQFAIGPGGVTGLAVTQSTNSSVSLNWTGEGIVTGYEIFRAEGEGPFRLVGRRAVASYTDTELTSGTKYSYKVRAYVATESGNYYSDFSAVVQGNT